MNINYSSALISGAMIKNKKIKKLVRKLGKSLLAKDYIKEQKKLTKKTLKSVARIVENKIDKILE